jgi:hypothetical protein
MFVSRGPKSDFSSFFLHHSTLQLSVRIYAASSFFLRISLRVSASAANLLIPSRNFSTAIWSSLKSKRKSASLSMYVFRSISRDLACEASSFLGTASLEPWSSSRRLGWKLVSICSRECQIILTEMVK